MEILIMGHNNYICSICGKKIYEENRNSNICNLCLGELDKERLFEFDKIDVPTELVGLLKEIEDNKRKWKSLYIATWGLILYELDPDYIKKGEGEIVRRWCLPAAKKGWVSYSPNELMGYLKNSDSDIYISQLIKIFILLEKYFFEYYKLTEKQTKTNFIKKITEILKNIVRKKKTNIFDPTYFKILKKYLLRKGFALKEELLKLELAKETRNCLIHKGIIDKRWLAIYKKIGRKEGYKEGDNVPLDFHDLEDWSDMLVEIVGKSLIFLKKDNGLKFL